LAIAFPNTFLIGVQKAGTTSLDNWMSQHPEIYSYQSLKDIHLFGLYKNKKEILERLGKEQLKPFNNQKVVLQSAVNYIFYPGMLDGIHRDAPESKIIVILRNPIDRAFSSYNYFKKMYREKRPIEEALIYEPRDHFQFTKDNNDFTYIEHGFYYQQLVECFHYFKKENVLILDFDRMNHKPEEIMQKVFSFLKIDTNFQPDFSMKNATGEVHSKWFQKQLVKNSGLKKWMMKYFVHSWLPAKNRNLIKRRMLEKNTRVKRNTPVSEKKKETIPMPVYHFLLDKYKSDVKALDQLLGTNYYVQWLGPKNEASL